MIVAESFPTERFYNEQGVGNHREVFVALRKGKGTTTDIKTIEQYCSVCKETYEMPIVDEQDDHEVVWLKCPGCAGFLPYMTDQGDRAEEIESDSTDEEQAGGLALEDIDIEKAKEYVEKSEYEVGEVIYHRSWNDYGKVIAKERLPGNRKTIHVLFVNQGKIRLLEGVT
jgi:hypothetical protein